MSSIDTFKVSILNYVNHFTMYDYASYAWLILLFFVTILLSILVARRSPLFSVLILLISLAILFAGPFVLKDQLDKYLRPSINKTLEVKKLNFSDSLIVMGNIKNVSKKEFSLCSINISLIKNSDNNIKYFINKLKPLRKQTISINDPIEVNTTKEFRVVFDRYTYSKDINVSIKSQCY